MISVTRIQAGIQQVTTSKLMVATTVFVLIVLSWYYMLFGMSMNMQPVASWSLADLFLLLIMWAIMMAGMMLPSAYPVIMLVEKINQQRKQNGASHTATQYFILGYLLAWSLYSVAITLVQYSLHYGSLLSPMMISANNYFSAALLICAGLYQFTAMKNLCLNHCRSPLGMLTLHWQEGIKGAIQLGFKHGQYCLGCCWVLMGLLFVTGVMNLKWILLLTAVVLIEKVLIKKPYIDKILGGALIAIGGTLLLASSIKAL